ncbi:MAG: hypothetical protein HQK54_16470, partial [Oligoflexales bacterium]|nr:hypothetical protein [Oligoflexales bacterium]
MRFDIYHFAVTALIFAVSCGEQRQKENPKKTERNITTKMIMVKPSDDYFVSDPDCQEGRKPAANRIDGGRIYLFYQENSNNYLTKQSVSFSGFSLESSPALHASHISSILTGSEYVRYCTGTYAAGECLDGNRYVDWNMSKGGAQLRFCDSFSDYDRNSYEGIAVTSVYYIENALSKYEKALGRRIAGLELEVLPLYQSVYVNEEDENGEKVAKVYSLVRNLAYFPGRNKIAVFPESERQQKFFSKNGHLWENSFSMAHEAAHHIETIIAPPGGFKNRNTLIWNPLVHEYYAFPGSNADEYSVRFYSAVSEAFADIMGFYAVSENEGMVTSLFDFGYDRNPKNPYMRPNYEAKKEKRLDERLYHNFFSPAREIPALNKVSPHGMGAVIAHGMYEIFSQMIPAESPSPEAMNEREKALINLTAIWIEKLHYAASELQNAKADRSSYLVILAKAIAYSL